MNSPTQLDSDLIVLLVNAGKSNGRDQDGKTLATNQSLSLIKLRCHQAELETFRLTICGVSAFPQRCLMNLLGLSFIGEPAELAIVTTVYLKMTSDRRYRVLFAEVYSRTKH